MINQPVDEADAALELLDRDPFIGDVGFGVAARAADDGRHTRGLENASLGSIVRRADFVAAAKRFASVSACEATVGTKGGTS